MEIHKHFKFNPIFIMYIWDYSVVSIAVYYRLGQSEDRISVGDEIFHTHLEQPWDPPSLLYSGYCVSSCPMYKS